jgi:hypothetical protein
MPTTTEVSCPKCGGAMWDNRETKKNPKAPDYKCRDRGCDGVIWPPKNGQRATVSAPPAEKQGYSTGGPLPYEVADAPIAHAETGAPPSTGKLDDLFHLYDVCFEHAYQIAHKKMGADCTHEGIAAQAAALFIAAKGAR